jgi:hypothetical protein
MECPIDMLRQMIKREEQSLEIVKSTLKTMIDVLNERMATPPPVQSDQSDEDPREKSESRAGIPSFERDAERRAVDVIL